MAAAASAVRGLSDALRAVTNVPTGSSAGITANIPAVQKLTKAWQEAGQAAKQAYIDQNGPHTSTFLGRQFQTLGGPGRNQLKDAQGKFMSVADTQAALDRAASFAARLKILLGNGIKELPNLGATLGAGFVAAVPPIQTVISQIVGAVQGAAGAVQSVGSALAQAGGIAISVASGIGSGIASIGSAALSVAGSITRGILSPLRAAVGLAGRVGDTLKRAAGGAGAAAGALATGAGLAITGVSIASIRNAVSFEQQLATINTIFADLTKTESQQKAELGTLGDSLQELSVKYGVSIADMTSAEYEFLSAGIGLFKTMHNGHLQISSDARQSAEALDAASKLSLAGLSTETQAVQLLSFALNSYNLNQKTVSKATAADAGLFYTASNGVRVFANSMGSAANIISDMFAKAVEIGVVKADQIARTFAQVAPSAKVAGIGIDEISAAYASQTVRGVSAARVMTNMNRAIIDLIKPGKQLLDLQTKTNTVYADLARTKGIAFALQQMRTDADRLGISYATLFKRQQGWMFALNITQDNLKDASGNYALYNEVLQQIRDSTTEVDTATGKVGTSAIQAEQRMHTVGREFDRVKIAFQVLTERIGRPLLDPLRLLLQQIVGIEVTLAGWARENQKLIGSLGPVIGGVGLLLSLTAGTQGLLFVFQRIAPVFGLTGTNVRGLATMMGRLAIPVALIVGLLGAFQYLVENNVRGFSHFTAQLDAMKAVAADVVNVFHTIAAAISYVWNTIGRGGDVQKAISTSLDAIGESVGKLAAPLQYIGRWLLSLAVSIGSWVVGVLQKVIPEIVGWLGDLVGKIAPGLLYVSGAIVGWAASIVPQVIAKLGDLAGDLINWAQDNVPGILTALVAWTGAFVGWAATLVPKVLAGIGDFAGGLIGWAQANVPVIAAALLSWTKAFLGWAVSVGRTIIANMGPVLGQIAAWVVSVAATVAGYFGTWVAAVQQFLVTNGPTIVAAIGTWATQAAQWIANDFFPTVQRALGEFLDSVQKFLSDTQFVRVFVQWALTFVAGIIEVLAKVAATILANADKIIGVLVEVARQAIAGMVDFFAQHGGEIVGAIGGAILGHPDAIVEAIAGVLLIAAAASAVSAAATVVGRAISFAMFDAKLFLAGILDTLASLLGSAVVGAGRAIGWAIGQAITLGTKAAMAVFDWVVALLPQSAVTAATTAGGAAGTTIGTALGLAIPVAAAAAVVATFVLVSNAMQAQADALITQTDQFIKKANRAQLVAALEATKKAFLDVQVNADAVSPLTGGLSNLAVLGTLQDLKTQADHLQAQIDGIDTGAIKEPVAAKGSILDSVTWTTAADAAGKFNSTIVGVTAKWTPAQIALNDLAKNFTNGLNAKFEGIQGFDWHTILGVDTATQDLQTLQSNFDSTFSSLTASLKTPTSDLTGAMDKFYKTIPEKIDGKVVLGKNGKPIMIRVPITFTADATRISAINTAIGADQKLLAAAKAQGDTASALLIQSNIDALEQQKTALQNAAALATQSATDAAKAAATAQQTLDTYAAATGNHSQPAAPTAAPPKVPDPTDITYTQAWWIRHGGSYAPPLTPTAKPRVPDPTDITYTQAWWIRHGGSVTPSAVPTATAPKVPDPTDITYTKAWWILHGGTLTPPAGAATATTALPVPTIEGKKPADYVAQQAQLIASIQTTAQGAVTAIATEYSSLTPMASTAGGGAVTALAAAFTAAAASGTVGTAVGRVTADANATLDKVGPLWNALGMNDTYEFSLGVQAQAMLDRVTKAVQAVTSAAASGFANTSWFGYGANLVQSLIDGMLSKITGPGSVTDTSLKLAGAAGKYAKSASPPKEGPLKDITRWGRELIHQFSLGMDSGVGLVTASSMGVASAAAGVLSKRGDGFMGGGARSIVPIRPAAQQAGPSGYDAVAMDRQIELLAEIAAASRLGAAAASRGASRDPQAGGPLAARSALVSFKQMSVSRTRGG